MFGTCVYKGLPRAATQLPRRIITEASQLFARDTGLSGPQIFDFFSQFSDAIGSMRYGSGAPSRWQMFEEFLESLPAEIQRNALLQLCGGYPFKTPVPVEQLTALREKLLGTPVPKSMGQAVLKVDSEYITRQWEKILRRLPEDA